MLQPPSPVSDRAAQVDALVKNAFSQTQPPVTVAAVGGYGRRHLFPFSDVDLLLLCKQPPPGESRDQIAEFLRILWDSGLRVSQSAHSPAECCEIHDGNLELTISLLDRRYLAGDEAPYAELERLFPKFLNAERGTIVHHLALMTRGRHARHGSTIYHLEPNVKEHPGGLRDLHVIHWLRKLRSLDIEPLDEATDFLFDLRTRLHEYFGRDNNVLTFEAQEWLSPEPAAWMRQYYRNARQISRETRRALEICEFSEAGLLRHFQDWRSRLSNTEFTVSRGQVLLRQPAQLDPMRLMEFVARHQLVLARDTEARLAAAPNWTASWTGLRTLLGLPRCANALRIMADLGLLQHAIPEWSRIDCLVVRDFYHRYTVDEHTLVALESLEKLDQGPLAGLLTEVDRIDLLRFALLLHDIGKGEGANHAQKAATLARDVMNRLEVPAEDQEAIAFLIEHHLDLSAIMTSRDLHDPATARQIAAATVTMERLKLLTLLTYADIAAVNPTSMTPWRLEQLWQVYRAGHQEFTRELDTERIQMPGEAFLEGLPTRYLKTHTRQEIAHHIELAQTGVAVELTRKDGSYRLTAIAADRPFLLASISGALASFGMTILKTEAFANKRGQVVDQFVFADPHRTLELNPEEGEQLQDTVLRAITGKVDVKRLVEKRRRPVAKARQAPRVSFANDISATCTLIEVVAEDRPLLLYDLTQALSSAGANIEVVLVDTEAHRALDVFYVTEAGLKLSENRMESLKQKLLQVCHG